MKKQTTGIQNALYNTDKKQKLIKMNKEVLSNMEFIDDYYYYL